MDPKSTDPLTSDKDIKFLTENSDLSPLQAKELIELLGRDNPELLKEAKKFKAESWNDAISLKTRDRDIFLYS